MSNILTVFGATGVQGGSVVRAVTADSVLSKTFKIRAVTRDASVSSAQDLIKQGIELVTADMNSRFSLTEALKGTHTVFLVTLPDFVTGAAPGTEVEHGKNLADAAKEAGKYFVDVAKNRSNVLGKQIYAAADYYTPTRIMAEFQEEILENELLCEEPGFYAGGSLTEGHELLSKVGLAPTTWKEFLEKPVSPAGGVPQNRGHRVAAPLFPNARANQPAIRHKPPRGVTGPINRKRSLSSVRAYKLPLNMVMPAVKKAPATGLLLATRRATE
ncbi:hypothetical protein CHGG_00038 [Chaetomium globosum CBS 148.51]|uniref:NmrA-like domain-containing protein n=1 Tax=Chaetomium globosum (strain ATCC 6205 / CBS 148.51 / DSM 1962 / NBRC 6347 / NRRL 1970) TaxID=306901 RepID=Q2HIB6_CHAGB|nr:uncharacterized protein CHGG_00038 [Chaetomium globosum CBS 148.51]EAQ91803.1 hypothetical protein CHGG_00038 [Chaetomium globosum CBS 148.51]